MDAQSMLGSALDRSKFTNGVIFHNPEMNTFCVSADHILDTQRQLSNVFPDIQHDGWFVAKFKSDENDSSPPEFEIGGQACMTCPETSDISSGFVVIPPTSKTGRHSIELEDTAETSETPPDCVHSKCNVPACESKSWNHFKPDWLTQDQQVTILKDDGHHHCCMNLSKDDLWHQP